MARTMTLTYGGQTGWTDLDAARTERERKAEIRAMAKGTLGHARFKVVAVRPAYGPQGQRTYRVTFEASPAVVNAIVGEFSPDTVVTVDGWRWVAGDFRNWYRAGMPTRGGEPVKVDESGEEI